MEKIKVHDSSILVTIMVVVLMLSSVVMKSDKISIDIEIPKILKFNIEKQL